ncbi:lung seven transmembrane receptor domain-containing protein [Hirsutella rhossiliensis]|uniref:Lung seven transmembrane receptor domain-containing protein n=1 Tax=Hirsutella rhossiliensis TaxID=111463 RepID=A0A9P8SFY0_9HYPO|nr:lung seven transmembrane receptor domain-containing protein [Hirsutella rhossiliensis]KAH0960544.1 lung seven transmembrane receptor domain-containing protein [Hirsutella rhossiliensis]
MRLLLGLLVLGLSLWTADALEVGMDQSETNRQYCSGMYSRTTWGGPVDPFILVKFLNSSIAPDSDPVASLIIFEWRDKDLVGVPDPNFPGMQLELCHDESVQNGRCNSTDLGQFILAPNATEKSNAVILTKAIHLNDPAPVKYAIKKTGYYCVITDVFTAETYGLVTEFRNAYGELLATQIPKLPFYGGMTILYALVCVFWGFLYYQHRHDILAVQNYITTILVFLVVEMLMTWAFYDYQNRIGSNAGSKVLLIVVGIFNAARNSFSFFLLLIVCMGYGVVKPTLGRTMIHVRWLAAAHFVFGLVYAITSLLISPESAGPFVLLIVLPLAGTLTAFYVWTLNSLNFTLKNLRERKQHAKEAMYKKLWWAILTSVLVIFGFFFFNSFTFASVNDPDFAPFHWKTRWFVLDGWLNIVYFADVVWVAYIWRPTANNRRFAMSDEIAQDDDGNFEIGDLGFPGDSDDDEEAQAGKSPTHQPPARGASGAGPTARPQQRSEGRDIPRESLEGETIFAVGEDGDRFSEDGSDEEGMKLVRAK